MENRREQRYEPERTKYEAKIVRKMRYVRLEGTGKLERGNGYASGLLHGETRDPAKRRAFC